MVETVGSQNPLRQVGQTEGVQQTTGTAQTQGTRGVGTEPPQAMSQQRPQSIPQNDPPRITPQQMMERFDSIIQQLGAGQDADLSQITKQIEELQYALDQAQLKTQTTALEGNKKAIDANTEAQLKKISEAKEKMEAQKTWDTFKNIFMWAAMAISVVAAVATGGALAIACAAIGAAMTIMQQSGLQDKMFDAMNLSQEARMGITIGISVLLLAGSIGNVAMLAKGVGTSLTTSLAPKLLEALKFANVADALRGMASTVQVASTVAGGVLKINEGATQIGSSIAGFQKEEANKQVKDMSTMFARLKQQQAALIDQIKEILEQLDEGVQTTAQIVHNNADSAMRRMRPAS
jgi:hypothetical protein